MEELSDCFTECETRLIVGFNVEVEVSRTAIGIDSEELCDTGFEANG